MGEIADENTKKLEHQRKQVESFNIYLVLTEMTTAISMNRKRTILLNLLLCPPHSSLHSLHIRNLTRRLPSEPFLPIFKSVNF